MARIQTITWPQRVRVFFVYRATGTKYQTAKRCSIARSTVGLIVQNFLDHGFSERPRADLPPELLREAQEQHIEEVVRALRQATRPDLPHPTDHIRARVEPVAALGDDASGNAKPQPLTSGTDAWLSPDTWVAWHLKGCNVEAVMQKAEAAEADYNAKNLDLWRAVVSFLGEETGLPVYAFPADDAPLPERGVFHTLVDFLTTDLLEASRHDAPLQLFGYRWAPAEQDPKMLAWRNTVVAVGEVDEHNAVQKAVEQRLPADAGSLQRQARDLLALHHDLGYLGPIVRKHIGAVDADTMREGICPACPYPEDPVVTELAEEGAKISRRRQKT